MTSITIPRRIAGSDRNIQSFLRWNVARNIVVRRQQADEWSCLLETQDSVEDARTPEGVSKTVVINTGLTYRFVRKGEKSVLEGPGLRELALKGRAAYRRLAKSAESALLPDLYEKLVRVSVVEVAMGPLQSILTDLATEGQLDVVKAGRRYRSPANFAAYVEMLRDLDYAKREGSALVPGASFDAARTIRSDEDSSIHWMMGDILQKRGGYMRSVLRWNMMVPYLRWTNAYYWRALEADRLPLMSFRGLQLSYSDIYGNPTHGHPTTQVMRLAKAEVFKKVDSHQYVGYQDILDPYAQRASERPDIAEALQLAAAG